MARLPLGILGPVSGKVGNVVGGTWRGIDYLRAMPANVGNPRTEAQLNQRGRFVMMLRFLQPALEFVKVGFKPYAVKMSTYNAAMSYNLRNAMVGTFPDFSIRYADVRFSRGNLRAVDNVELASNNALELEVGWADNSGVGNAAPSDRLLLLAYNVEDQDVFLNFQAGVRSDGQTQLTLPISFAGKEVHVWLTLTNLPELILAGDRNSLSNSVYAGNIAIAS